MRSPFPGMDPYLEHPRVWPGFHDKLVVYTVEVLQPLLTERGYYVDSNRRVWLEEPERSVYPDNVVLERAATRPSATATLVVDEPVVFETAPLEFRESYVEVFERETHRVVTGIEFVSPANKLQRKGRKLYRRKQRETRRQGIHLVEVDLIRRGRSVVDVPARYLAEVAPFEYVAHLGRRKASPIETSRIELYPIRLRDRLPRIRIPLKNGDEDAVLDLQQVFERSYAIGAYPGRLDYDRPPSTPLNPEDEAWAEELLIRAGLRRKEGANGDAGNS